MSKNVSDLNVAAQEYARYLEFMLTDISRKPSFQRIERTFLRNAELDRKAIEWHFHDLTPTPFEMCLLGKFC